MKELSIEEKAHRYDEAIKEAVIAHKDEDKHLKATLERIFPELKEDEDERIRKELLEHCKNQAKPYIQTGNKCPQIQSWIDWLEKKGEHNYKIIKGKNYLCVKTHNYAGVEWIKGTKYYASDNYTLVNQGCECYSPEYSKEEHNNLFEEVIADKVEPKFKVGDWVVNNNGEPQFFQVISRSWPDSKIKKAENNLELFINTATLDKQYHLWSVQDAKDGDVIAIGNVICIFKKMDTAGLSIFWTHCEIIGNSEFGLGFSFSSDTIINPASKEQRDFLFSKMKEAGYNWDTEKKELKKIEQNVIEPDDLIEESYQQQADDLIDMVTEKPAWDEEDERIYKVVLELIDSYSKGTIGGCIIPPNIGRYAKWFKALKDRVQLQPKQEWSEEDERYYNSIIEHLKYSITNGKPETYRGGCLTDWLRNLKNRYI